MGGVQLAGVWVSSLILTQHLKQRASENKCNPCHGSWSCHRDTIPLCELLASTSLPYRYRWAFLNRISQTHFPEKSLEKFVVGYSQRTHCQWFHRSSYFTWVRGMCVGKMQRSLSHTNLRKRDMSSGHSTPGLVCAVDSKPASWGWGPGTSPADIGLVFRS